MNDHAKRLRHMAAGWLLSAESTESYGVPRDKKRDIDHYVAQAAALLAGAEALERLEAMESASSTMLPKSASASEEGECIALGCLEGATAVEWVDEQEGRNA